MFWEIASGLDIWSRCESTGKANMPAIEENRQKLRYLLEEVVPSGDSDSLAKYVHNDVVIPTNMPGGKQGLAGYIEGLARSKIGIEYTHSVIDTVAEGDRVVARILVKGKQTGEVMGIPNRGKEFTFEQMVIAQFREGRICQFWRVADLYSLVQQLGG